MILVVLYTLIIILMNNVGEFNCIDIFVVIIIRKIKVLVILVAFLKMKLLLFTKIFFLNIFLNKLLLLAIVIVLLLLLLTPVVAVVV